MDTALANRPAMPMMISKPHASPKAATAGVEPTDEPPSAAQPLKIGLEINHSPGMVRKIDVDWLHSRLANALNLIAETDRRPIDRVEILITDDASMTALHRTHSGVDGTTDVLTFDHSEAVNGASDSACASVQADIAVCADEAARRSAEFGHAIERELLLYCIHGVLHCIGFDDHSETDFAAMHAEEDRILKAIGVGETFHAGKPNSGPAGSSA